MIVPDPKETGWIEWVDIPTTARGGRYVWHGGSVAMLMDACNGEPEKCLQHAKSWELDGSPPLKVHILSDVSILYIAVARDGWRGWWPRVLVWLSYRETDILRWCKQHRLYQPPPGLNSPIHERQQYRPYVQWRRIRPWPQAPT